MQKDEAVSLTNLIESECTDEGVLIKVWETRAIIYTHSEQYDSVLYYVDLMQKHGYAEPTGLLLKSRALRGLGEKDSSVYYAQQVHLHR